MILSTTKSYCSQCSETHPGKYIEEGNKVYFEVLCPARKRRVPVSTDARMFQMFRKQVAWGQSTGSAETRRRFFFIEVTDSCNMDCPICYANAGPSGKFMIDLETVQSLGNRIKAVGGRWISLTGGEPTVHPQLPEIISLLRNKMRLSPLIVSNGLRIAEDYDYLLRLKRAGLDKVQLQFDTFDSDTYLAMRGRSDLNEKFRAIENIRKAGLRIGLVTTVCRYNLSEVNRIVDFSVSLTPFLNTLILQAILPEGRFPSNDISVDREAIIGQVCHGGERYVLSGDDFSPVPQFEPLQMSCHPDCAACCFVKVDEGQATPVNQILDVPELFRSLNSYRSKMSYWRGNLAFLHCLTKALKRKRDIIDLLLRTRSIRTGEGNKNLFLITVGSFMRQDFRDEERLSRCASCHVSPKGLESMCAREMTKGK